MFYSGAPTTFPVGRYYYEGEYHSIYSTRNEDTMPPYHRMDLSLTYRGKKRVEGKRWGGEWNLSVYNVYGRHNAWAIAFSTDMSKPDPETRKVYLFSVVPSIAYSLKF